MARVPARRNDRVVCRHGAEPVTVSVGPNGFELPDPLCLRGRTAFLALDVEATLAGRVREPWVEVRGGAATHRQYFDRGASGLRYLNLSPVLQEGGNALAAIGLRGDALRWQSRGWLTSFEPPATADETILVLAPHPDDAEIAAFGLYATHPSSSWVVTMTAGERGAMDLSKVLAPRSGNVDARWKASLRVWDSVTIPQLGGISGERCLNLAYPDGQLESMSREVTRAHRLGCEPGLSRDALRARNRDREFQRASSACTWAGLVSELRLLLDKAKPGIVVCPHPLIDDHPDHAFTTVALEQALRHSAHQVPTFLLYVVHARDARAYPYGTGEAVVSLPPWTDERWLADSIYSHSLPAELRRGKYFAVEAAHDLRTYGDGAPKTLRQLLGVVKREASAFVGRVAVDPMSAFLRRASRPNEVYYVVSADSLSQLVKRRSPNQ